MRKLMKTRTLAKRRSVAILAIGPLVALALTACGDDSEGASTESGQASVTLTSVVPFSGEAPEDDGYHLFLEKLKQKAPWVSVVSRGGPESIPAFDQTEAVSEGVVDMTPAPAPYLKSLVPMIEGTTLTPYTPLEERKAGVHDFWTEQMGDAGLKYLGNTMASIGTKLWLNKRITTADLSGLQLRVSESVQPLVKALGGGAVTIDAGETYTAVERGVVDGVSWVEVGMSNFGWDEVVKYELENKLYPAGAIMVVMNPKKWESLSSETQEAIVAAMEEAELEVVDLYKGIAADQKAEREAAGVEPITLSEAEGKKFAQIVHDAGWDALTEIDAAKAGRLKDLYDAAN